MINTIDLTNKRILISRTDSIGDVMLTLPICSWIKQNFKGTEIIFLGNNYTKAVVNCFSKIDSFIDWKEIESLPASSKVAALNEIKADVIIHVFPRKEIAKLSKKAKITFRVGTSHRLFHFLTCTHKVNFTRKKSVLHESQLNFELLRPFGLTEIPDLDEINKITSFFKPPSLDLPREIAQKINSGNKNIILHPKSQGSAVEWGVEKYNQLALQLEKKDYNVFFTGNEKKDEMFRKNIQFTENIIDTSGKFTLSQLIEFISKCSTLIACSTGPFHIAGYLNIQAIGLFSPRIPIHPGRWKALGNQVTTLVNDENCAACKAGKFCTCVEQIPVERIIKQIK